MGTDEWAKSPSFPKGSSFACPHSLVFPAVAAGREDVKGVDMNHRLLGEASDAGQEVKQAKHD